MQSLPNWSELLVCDSLIQSNMQFDQNFMFPQKWESNENVGVLHLGSCTLGYLWKRDSWSMCIGTVFNVGSKCVQSGFKMHSKCIQRGFKVGSKWDQSGFKVRSKWIQSGFKVCSKWIQNAFKVYSNWLILIWICWIIIINKIDYDYAGIMSSKTQDTYTLIQTPSISWQPETKKIHSLQLDMPISKICSQLKVER